MRCEKCGNENSGDALYCAVCYEPFKKETQRPSYDTDFQENNNFRPAPVKKNSTGITGRIILYSLLLAGIIFFIKIQARMDWKGYTQKITVGQFTIYSDLPEAQTRKYLGACIAFRQYFDENILKVKNKKMRLYVFKDNESYINYCSRIKAKSSEYGFYSKAFRTLVVNHGTGVGTLFHEMVHYLVDISGYKFSSGVEEGLAVFFEKFTGYYENSGSYALSYGYFSPWRTLEVKQSRDMIGVKYINDSQSIAGSMMMFIHKNGRLKEFLTAYNNSKDVNNAIQKVFGKNFFEFEKDWLNWVDSFRMNDRNVNFIEASTIFDTKHEFEKFISDRKAHWDKTEKLYKI